MLGIIEAKKARQEHNALKSRWSDESCLSQKILISLLARLEQQNKLLMQIIKTGRNGRPKRKLTAYMKFFAQQAKEGKSAVEIGRLWKLEKANSV